MHYIDPHIHMASRVTDDIEQLARTGCVAVTEPAFWAGFDRCSARTFYDHFRQLTEFEPLRAARYGIQHYCWMAVNAKEAQNVSLSREVLSFIPEFLNRPKVLGIGEAGLNKNTKNEVTVFVAHVELAATTDELLLVHTPHLQDKYKGTRMILDILRDIGRLSPQRVLIDHVEEHTIEPVMEAGHWVGLTLYPTTKCTPARAVDLVERYGTERIWVSSSADWNPSNPGAVMDFIMEMRRRNHSGRTIRKIVYENPIAFLSQCARWEFTPPDTTP